MSRQETDNGGRSEPWEVLSADEEAALGAIRMAVAGIREGRGVADVASIVGAVIQAVGASAEAGSDGGATLRLGSARLSVQMCPGPLGRVAIDFGPPIP
jgi:hypothetical protein